MIKINVIHAIIFSGLLTFLFVLGGIYAGGVQGKIVDNSNNLTTEGKFGAGLISIAILVWLWAALVFAKPFIKWHNKSIEIIIIFSSVFLMPIISLIYGIIYLVLGKHGKEKIQIIEKEGGE